MDDLEAIRELYPFQSHFLPLAGHHMHYLDEGSGPAIVMVHGNPTWSFYFRDLIKGLRDKYRVIVPDHIGCGLSHKPQRYPYTLATHTRNLECLLNHLGVRDVTLAVHDWGGAIGFGWAARHADLVKRFVIFNTAAFFGPIPLRIRASRWPLIGTLGVRGLNLFARAATIMACKNRKRMTPKVKRGYLLPYDSHANRVAVLEFVRDIPTAGSGRSRETVQQIEAALPQFGDRPMIIFWGGKDFCFNDHFLSEWKRRFPAAEAHRFADAGHYVVEDAHERILPLLRRFLDSGTASPASRA